MGGSVSSLFGKHGAQLGVAAGKHHWYGQPRRALHHPSLRRPAAGATDSGPPVRAKEDLLSTAFDFPRTRRDSWQDDAACQDSDVELFFPTDGERGLPRTDREAAAKTVCADCLVRTPCLEFALSRGETHGIWGGMTEDERASERRRRRRATA